MDRWWRAPILPIGIALFCLGVGNWVLSHDKIVEYTQRASPSNTIVPNRPHADFPALTAHTNATVLERLHAGGNDYTDVDAKLDFYKVVEGGGRALTLLGLACITIALLRRWRAPRAQLRVARSSR